MRVVYPILEDINDLRALQFLIAAVAAAHTVTVGVVRASCMVTANSLNATLIFDIDAGPPNGARHAISIARRDQRLIKLLKTFQPPDSRVLGGVGFNHNDV